MTTNNLFPSCHEGRILSITCKASDIQLVVELCTHCDPGDPILEVSMFDCKAAEKYCAYLQGNADREILTSELEHSSDPQWLSLMMDGHFEDYKMEFGKIEFKRKGK